MTEKERKEKWNKEHNIKIAIIGHGSKLAQMAMEMYEIKEPKQEEKKYFFDEER